MIHCSYCCTQLGITKSERECATLRNIRVMASMQQQLDQRSDAAISSRGTGAGSNRVVAVDVTPSNNNLHPPSDYDAAANHEVLLFLSCCVLLYNIFLVYVLKCYVMLLLGCVLMRVVKLAPSFMLPDS